eukprot:551796_1
MKHCIALSVLSAVFLRSSASNSRLLLQTQDNDQQTCSCTREFSPLCCDQETYDNPCLAECNGLVVLDQCVSGPCTTVDGPCICTLEYNPVCCNDLPYGNLCNAQCAGFTAEVCVSGLCVDIDTTDFVLSSTVEPDALDAVSTDCVCTLEDDPVCCNGVTFGNPCAAACEDQNGCVPGECTPDDCVCTADYNPVCCDGIDYSNACGAECDGHNTDECAVGDCESTRCACGFDENPICCNGNQYANSCLAECDGVERPAQDQTECSAGGCVSDCVCTLEYVPLCCEGQDYGNACNAECDGINPIDCATGTCCDAEFPVYAPICCQGIEYSSSDKAHCNGFDTSSCVEGPCNALAYCRSEDECDADYECEINPYGGNGCPLGGNEEACEFICIQRGEICGGVVGEQLCQVDEICIGFVGARMNVMWIMNVRLIRMVVMGVH